MREFISKNRRRIVWSLLILISLLTLLSDIQSGQFKGVNVIIGPTLLVLSLVGFILKV